MSPLQSNDRDWPKWLLREIAEEADRPRSPWSLRRRLAAIAACAALSWVILIFAIIGAVAVLGDHL